MLSRYKTEITKILYSTSSSSSTLILRYLPYESSIQSYQRILSSLKKTNAPFEKRTQKALFTTSLWNVDIPQYQVSISVSKKEKLIEWEGTVFTMFASSKVNVYLSSLSGNTIDVVIPITEELWRDIDAIHVFLLKLFLGSETIYTLDEWYQVQKELEYLSIPFTHVKKFDYLSLKELKWGALIGNKETEYTAMRYAGGKRTLLVFSKTGIWFFSVENRQWNRLYEKEDRFFTGSVFEGELVAISDREENAPICKYWLLIYDTLARDGTIGVRQLTHADRMRHTISLLRDTLDTYKNTYVYLSSHSFRSFYDPSEFYETMRLFLLSKGSLGYQDKGLLFIPERISYEEGKKLVWVADMEFHLLYRNFQFFALKKEEWIEFFGTKEYPAKLDMNALTQTGEILTFRKETNTLRSVGASTFIDSIEEATQKWLSQIEKVEEATLRGETFQLFFQYQKEQMKENHKNALKDSPGAILIVGEDRFFEDPLFEGKRVHLLALEDIETLTGQVAILEQKLPKKEIMEQCEKRNISLTFEMNELPNGKWDVVCLHSTLFLSTMFQQEDFFEWLRTQTSLLTLHCMDGDVLSQVYAPTFFGVGLKELSFRPYRLTLKEDGYTLYNDKEKMNAPYIHMMQLLYSLPELRFLTWSRGENEFFLTAQELIASRMYMYGVLTFS